MKRGDFITLRLEQPTSTVEDRLSDMESQITQARKRLIQARLAASQKDRASGVRFNHGKFDYEANIALKGPGRWATYSSMMADAHIKGSFRQMTLPLVAADWKFEPASPDQKDVEVAEFCNANLLRIAGPKYGREYFSQTSWIAQRLPEILDMMESGFSMFSKTKRVVGSKRVFDKIKWLEPSSVDPAGWNLSSTDEILDVKRTFLDPSGNLVLREAVDFEEIALYVWDLKGARFEGMPWLRSMYGAWYRKNKLLQNALTWAARIGNPPPFGYYPTSWSATVVSDWETMMQTLRGEPPENAWGSFPKGTDGVAPEIHYPGAETSDIDRFGKPISHENAEIAHAGGSVTSLLGETGAGNRALGEVIAKIERMFALSVAALVIEFETNGVGNLMGNVEELVFENFSVSQLPKLTCKGVDPDEKTKNVPAMSSAVKDGSVPALPEIAYQITERLGFDVPLERFEQADAEKKAAEKQAAAQKAMDRQSVAKDGQAPAEPSDTGDDEGEEDVAASLAVNQDAARAALAPMMQPAGGPVQKNARRGASQFEAEYANLAAVRDAYRVGESAILAALRRVQRLAVAELVARMNAGKITARGLDGLRRSKFRGATAAKAELQPALDTTGQTGARHVADEVSRQMKVGISLSWDDGEEIRIAGMALQKDLIRRFEESTNLLAELDVGRVWAAMVEYAIEQFTRLMRQNTDDAELARLFAQALEGVSDKPLVDIARQSAGVAYNQGRDVALKAAKADGVAQFAVRSEVLDASTCQFCHDHDQQVVEIGSAEYEQFLPPAGCDGGDRCRGFYLVVTKDLFKTKARAA